MISLDYTPSIHNQFVTFSVLLKQSSSHGCVIRFEKVQRSYTEDSQNQRSFSERISCGLCTEPFQVPKPQDLERSGSVFSWRQSSMHWTSYHRGGSISLSSSRYYRLMSEGLWYASAWWCAIKCLLVCIYYCVHMAPDWCFGESTDLSQTFPLPGP